MSFEVKDYRTLGSPGKIEVKGSFPKADFSKWIGHKIMVYVVSCESASDVYVQLDGLETNVVLDMVDEYIGSLPPKEEPVTPVKHLLLNPRNELQFQGHSHSTYLTLTNTSDKCITFKVKTTLPKQYYVRPNGIDVIEPFSHKKVEVVYHGSIDDEHDRIGHTFDKFLIEAMFLQPGEDHTVLWENANREKIANFFLTCKFDATPIDDVDGNKESSLIVPLEQLKELNPGHPCLVFYPEDQGWYRARVLEKVDDFHYKMFFVDYGDEKILPLACIHDCPSHLVSFVEGITRCSLTGFYKTTPEELKVLKELLTGKDFIAGIENPNYHDRMLLSLFNQDGLPLKPVVDNLLQKENENENKGNEVHDMTKEASDNTKAVKQPLGDLHYNSLDKKISVSEEKKTNNDDDDDDEEEFFFSPKAGSFQEKGYKVDNEAKIFKELVTAEHGTQDPEFADMISSIRIKIKEKEEEIDHLTQQLLLAQQENKELCTKMENEKANFIKVLEDKEEIFSCKLLGQKKNFEKQLQAEKNVWQMDYDEMQRTLRDANKSLVSISQDSKLQIQKVTEEKEQAIQSLKKSQIQNQTEIELIHQKYKEELKKMEDTWSQKYQEKVQLMTRQKYEEVEGAQLKSINNTATEKKLKLLEEKLKNSQERQQHLEQRVSERTDAVGELTNSLTLLSSIIESQQEEIAKLRKINSF